MKLTMALYLSWLMLISLCLVVNVASSGNDTQSDTGKIYHDVKDLASSKCSQHEDVGCDLHQICYCDELCTNFNDCCKSSDNEWGSWASQSIVGDDSFQSSSEQGEMILNKTSYRVCVQFPSELINYKFDLLFGNEYTLPYGFWMIGKCPPSWRDVETKKLCEAQSDGSDHLLYLPFRDDTMTSFKNIYCALCHGVPITKLTSWKIKSGNFSDLETFQGLDTLGDVVFQFESNERMCLRDIVESCPDDYEDIDVERECHSYRSVVVHPTSRVIYRNWHCALCNGVIDPNLDICDGFTLIPNKIFSTSLTALVDFQASRIQSDNFTLDIYDKCGNGKFRDPFSMRCRTLQCPSGHQLLHGVCTVAAGTRPREPTGIRGSTCIDPGLVELEVDLCINDDAIEPCEWWEKCSSLDELSTGASTISRESCQTKQEIDQSMNLKNDARCSRLVRIRLVLTSNISGVNDLLKEKMAGNVTLWCHPNASITQVVLKRGCHVVPSEQCHEYITNTDTSVYLASWNQTGVVYLRDVNALYSLKESLYQISYRSHIGGLLNITHNVTHCGAPIGHFNCSFVAVNSSEFNRLLSDEDEPRSDDDHVALETGGALMCPHHVTDQGGVSGLTIVTSVGIILSMMCLVMSFMTYIVFPSLRNLAGKCVMSLIVAVFITHVLFLMTGDDVARSVGEASCAAMAVLLHYTCLSTFTWTNVLAVYLARSLVDAARPSAASQHRYSFWLFSLFAWGTPLAVVIVCLMLNLSPSIGLVYGVSIADTGIRTCSITVKDVEIVALVVPICLSLLVNLVLFVRILVGFTFRRKPSSNLHSNGARNSRMRRDAVISIKVGFLLAFTWIFGFLATGLRSEFLLYIFCIMTSMQGVYIFLAFTFTQQVRALWRERLGLNRPAVSSSKPAHKKYFRKWKKADKKDLCRKHSPSEHQPVNLTHDEMHQMVDPV